MVTKKQVKSVGKSIGFLAVTNSKGLISLLAKYNIKPTSLSHQAINDATVKAMANKSFVADFQKLLDNTLNVNFAGQYKNAEGSGGFFSGFNVGDVLGLGTTIFSGIAQTNAQKDLLKAQADLQADATKTAIAQGQLQLEAEKIRLEQIKAQNSAPSNNVLLYVGLGILGVLVIGGVIYAVTKK